MLEIVDVYMEAFKEQRRVTVYLPNTYESKGDQRYPVIYMHDGQNVFRDAGAIGGVSLSLEEYLDEKALDVIVVAIDQNSDERINEYCPWMNGEYSEKVLGHKSGLGGKGEQYIDFITLELKPFIDEKYRTLKDHTAMAGCSLGGLISVFAACKYPHIYKNIVGFSSAFWRNQEQIEELISKSDLSLIESIYLDWGDQETKDEKINKLFEASNQAVADLLSEKVPNFNYTVIAGGEHNYTAFKKRVPQIFSFMEKEHRTGFVKR
jgi:predicted alpha/beta superfamily hydrolase